jgi:lipopolysaccharide exporter
VSEGTASRVKRGAAWMLASRLVDTGVGMVSMIVLARLLTPADFGLMALGASLVAMLQLLRAFSFDMVLIHRQDAGRDEYDTAWTINLIFSALIALLLVSAASPMAAVYDDTRLADIVRVIALAKLIEGFQNIGIVDFRKELRFEREFLFIVLRRAGSFVITLTLALVFRNYWALVIGIVAGQGLATILSYAMHRFRPRLSLTAWRELLSFSKWNAINAVAHAISIRSGDFLVGKLAGPTGLGLFTVANDLSFMPSSELGAPINRAVYPGYAKIAHDAERLRSAFYRVISLIAIAVLPTSVGLAATADSFIPIVLDERWFAAIPLIAPLALRGLMHGLVSNVPYVYLAIGKPQLGTIALVARAVILLPLLWLGLERAGVLGAAWAFALSMVFEIPIHLLILRLQLDVKTRSVLARLGRPAVASVMMYLVVRYGSTAWAAPDLIGSALLRLGVLVVVGAVVYCASLLLLWWVIGRPDGAERMIIDTLNSRWTQWREGPKASA